MPKSAMELLDQLNGAALVVTNECGRCGVFAIAYWNGYATVDYATLTSGAVGSEDVWTNYELAKMHKWDVEEAVRSQLEEDMCGCSTGVFNVV